MATIKRRSAKRGQKAQQIFESVKNFCNVVSLLVEKEGVHNEMFANVFIGYLGDSSGLKKADGENMAAFDLRADKMAEDKYLALLNTEEGRAKLLASPVYRTMIDAKEMYKVFRESLPCYNDGEFNFAKPVIIAYRVSDLTAEELTEYDGKSTWQRIAIFTDGKDIEYICRSSYAANIESDLVETYKCRRAFLAEEKEQTKAFFKAKGRYIYALESANKGTFKTFAPALSVSLQEEAAAIRRRRAAAAEESRRHDKAAADSAAFIEKEGREKLADLAAVVVKIAAAIESGAYNGKAKAANENKIKGLINTITTKAEAVRAFYQAEAEAEAAKKEAAAENMPAAEAAEMPETAEELKKAAAIHAAAEAAADANNKEARKIAAAAELFGMKLKADAAPLELRRAAAPYLSGEAAEANAKAIKAAKAAAPESGEAAKPKAKGRQRKGAKNQEAAKAAASESVTAEAKAEETAAA